MRHRKPTARLAWLVLVLLLVVPGPRVIATGHGGPKYILIMLADGAGPGAFEIGRLYHRYVLRRGFVVTDTIMAAGNLGLMTTTSADTLLTDSASAATAMFTGYKTNVGMLGVTPDKQRHRNIAEAAKAQGYRIGLLSTDAVWDATPGAFAAHAEARAQADSIVDQFLTIGPDVLLGGGRAAFLPKTAGGDRADGRDMVAEFKARGYQYVGTAAELRKAPAGKLLGLFGNGALNLDLDRDANEPTYAEMVAAGLNVLSSSPQKFVAMFENEKTDAANHDNDLPSLLAALEDFDRGVRLAYAFYLAHPGETLLVVMSDHDTGGPGMTYAQKSPTAFSSRDRVYPTVQHLAMAGSARGSTSRADQMLGARPAAADIQRVMAQLYPGMEMPERYQQYILRNEMPNSAVGRRLRVAAFGLAVAHHTNVYWSTTGHTSTPVQVAAVGVGAEKFRGYMENTKFAKIMFELLGAK